MEDVPSGVVVGLSQENWLTRFYCLAGITLTPKEITSNQSLDPTLNAESNLNAVKSQCSDIIANSAKWSSVIGLSSEELTAKANNFVILHERSVGKQKEIESKKLIEQPLDEQKIAKFKEEVSKAWENSSEIRGIINKLGIYSEKPTVNEIVPLFGLQKWVPKSEFVKEPLTTVIGIEQFGQAIGRGENNTICSILLSNCSSRNVSENVMISNISETINEMKAKDIYVNALFVGSLHIIREFQKTELFKPARELKDSHYSNLQGYKGDFSGLPVFLVLELEKDVICLIDLKSIGTFNQYKVKENDIAILNFDIQFIDEKKASEFIKNNPKLKENDKGKILSDLEAARKLREFVLAKIAERFEFILENKEACNILRIKPNDSTPT